jgi:hypothetical protein
MKNKKVRFPKKSLCSGLKPDGSEICDPKPSELRVEMSAPVTMRQKMRQLWEEFRIKDDMAREVESLADAADFDVSNDENLSSPYESEGSLDDAINQAPEELPQVPEKEEASQPEAKEE